MPCSTPVGNLYQLTGTLHVSIPTNAHKGHRVLLACDRLNCLTKWDTGLGCECGAAPGSQGATPSLQLGLSPLPPSPSQGRPCPAPLVIQGTYHTPLSSRPASPGSDAGFGKGPHGHWSPAPHLGCPREDLGAGREMLREGCAELTLAARMGPGEKCHRHLFHQMASFPAKAVSWGLTPIETPSHVLLEAVLILLTQKRPQRGARAGFMKPKA